MRASERENDRDALLLTHRLHPAPSSCTLDVPHSERESQSGHDTQAETLGMSGIRADISDDDGSDDDASEEDDAPNVTAQVRKDVDVGKGGVQTGRRGGKTTGEETVRESYNPMLLQPSIVTGATASATQSAGVSSIPISILHLENGSSAAAGRKREVESTSLSLKAALPAARLPLTFAINNRFVRVCMQIIVCC